MRRFLGIGGACAALTLAVCPADASTPSEGPWLAFPAMNALKPWGFSIRGMKADGADRVMLVRGSRRGLFPNPFSTVSWSADGAWLAFAGSKGTRKGIYEGRYDGSGVRFLRGTEGGRNPTFSSDGSRLAFVRDDLQKFAATTWVAGASGGRAFRLTPERDYVEYLPSSFSPDGSALAVTRRDLRSNRSRVLLFGLTGRRSVKVLAGLASEAVFSPDGSHVLLVRQTMARKKVGVIINKDLYVMSTAGTFSEAVTRTRRLAETRPSWDPSGQRIAFNSYHISKEPIEALFDELLPFGNSIMEVNADGSCRQKILSLRNGALRGPVWRPGLEHAANRIAC